MEREGNLGKILIHAPYKLDYGGVSAFIKEIRPHLKNLGWNVVLAGPKSDGEENQVDYKLGRSIHFSLNETAFDTSFSLNKGRTKNLLLTDKPDIIVFHEPLISSTSHTVISALLKIKREAGWEKILPVLIGHFHGTWEESNFFLDLAIAAGKHAVRRPTYKKFKGIIPFPALTPSAVNTIIDHLVGSIAVSDATGNQCEKNFGIIPKVIPNGIDTDFFTFPDVLPNPDDKEEVKIFCAGRHDKRKGFDVAISALSIILSEFPTAKLLITGKGDETENLKQLVENLGLQNKVIFLGVVPKEQLREVYQEASVYAGSSTGNEGFGRVGPEAMACGTPAVMTRIPGHECAMKGLPHVVFVKPACVESMAEGIKTVLRVERRERLLWSRELHDAVEEKYSWPRVAKETSDYYNDLMELHGRPKPEDWPKKKRGEGKIRKLYGGMRKFKKYFYRKI